MKRVIATLYGLVAYVIFLVAFLYAIGFVGDFLVPKTINSGEVGGTTSSVLINLALLSLFALQHSIMARPGFKKWWAHIVPPVIERSTYALVSFHLTRKYDTLQQFALSATSTTIQPRD